VFGSILDSKVGGHFQISSVDHTIEGRQGYIVNTNVLTTTFQDDRGEFEVVDFAPRFHHLHRYYKPNMLMRIVRPISGQPLIKVNLQPYYNYGKTKCPAGFGSNHIFYTGLPLELRLTTTASLSMVDESRPFALDKTHYFVLTYGEPFESELPHTCEEFLDRTVKYWQTWVKHCYLPHEYQKEIIRSALVLKLHQYEDTGAIIASSTTSIPEAEGTVRCWDYRYCWLRDALFSLAALQRLTQFEEMEKFVVYLRNIVETTDSLHNLQPVYGISGETCLEERILDYLEGYRGNGTVRVGNQAFEHLQHDIYGEMILAISPLFLDQRFVGMESKPFNLLIRLLDKVEQYLESKDAGLWEFRGSSQLHTFTLLMHWAGAVAAGMIGKALSNSDLVNRCHFLANKAKKLIDEKCWNADLKAYTQAAGTKHLDAALLTMVNFGYLDPRDPKAATHVKAIAEGLKANEGFIYRYLAEDDFGKTDSAFIICSFWLVESLARIGEVDRARSLFERLLNRANHLGLYSEDLNPRNGDLWGNFPQTYSHVGLINAAFALSETTRTGYFFPAQLM
jgi:GH15 family glucan-1,4-alpha-glucosidase